MVAADPVAATDAALIAAWQRGDERAATELVNRHTRALARFLAGAGAPDADLDDLVQETFVRAFRAVDRFRGRVVPLDEDLRAPEGDPAERAVAAEAEERLGQELRRLPPMQRDVFLMRAQQGMEYDDIANALGTSTGAARVHYHHAVKRLKEHLR
jgi:RNA polymerase sigma-70 factor (ECF subfamily)